MMKRFFNAFIPILMCILIIGGSIVVLRFYVKGDPSSEMQDWADFATYLSVSLSLISVIYIYLTYRNQVSMSSVLQFESTFFQWYQIHTDLVKDLQPDIDKCVENVIYPNLEKSEFKDLTIFEQLAQKDIDRPLHRYYRSLYQLLKYIKISPILLNYDQRKKYYDIIQSNMSDEELLLFLCFVFGDENREKKVFKQSCLNKSIIELVDESHILKNCYVPIELRVKMNDIVRSSLPKTAKKSFHFFTKDLDIMPDLDK